MIVCALFWLIAIPFLAKLWSSPATTNFSWEERVMGSILIFMPILGVIFWFVYFGRPPSHRPQDISVVGEFSSIVAGNSVRSDMAETARHNASFLGRDIWMPEWILKAWRFLRWPFFLGLVVGVVWFNALLIR